MASKKAIILTAVAIVSVAALSQVSLLTITNVDRSGTLVMVRAGQFKGMPRLAADTEVCGQGSGPYGAARFCRNIIAIRAYESSNYLFRLPYSKTLHKLADPKFKPS